MEFRFNPDSGIVTIIRDRDAYNAKKQAKAGALLELWERGFDHSDDCCVICGARVDLSDIETFELSEFGMICYFCTCDPNQRAEIVDASPKWEVAMACKCGRNWGFGEVVKDRGKFRCQDCGKVLEPAVRLSSSLKSQNNPEK